MCRETISSNQRRDITFCWYNEIYTHARSTDACLNYKIWPTRSKAIRGIVGNESRLVCVYRLPTSHSRTHIYIRRRTCTADFHTDPRGATEGLYIHTFFYFFFLFYLFINPSTFGHVIGIQISTLSGSFVTHEVTPLPLKQQFFFISLHLANNFCMFIVNEEWNRHVWIVTKNVLWPCEINDRYASSLIQFLLKSSV